MFDTEVVVIGAGAAGLSAGRRLAALGIDFVLLEAKGRIGGRAHTDRSTLGLPFDLGCHWLHSADRNPLTPVAARFGFTATPARSKRRIHTRNGWATPAECEAWAGFEQDESRRVDQRGATGPDVPASTVLHRTHRWAGLYEAWFGILNGASPEAVSAADVGRYLDTGDNRQVREGLGALIARCGAGVPVHLHAPVRSVRFDGAGVEVEGAAGRIRARTVIVTVSITMLRRERIRFEPRLPEEKAEAFEGLRLGHALRIAVRFPPGTFGDPRRSHEIFADDSANALSFQVQPFGRPVATAYAGAGNAAELERAGVEAVRALVVERLAAMFGSAAAKGAGAAVMSRWSADPDVGGAYSYARPGGGEPRGKLARPVAERLWFAGEAASPLGFSTVHGAWETGREAADAAAAAMGRNAPASPARLRSP